MAVIELDQSLPFLQLFFLLLFTEWIEDKGADHGDDTHDGNGSTWRTVEEV